MGQQPPFSDITIIGGGPGGLYLSILVKRDWPHTAVRVAERNRANDTYGFGVAFHELTLATLASADPTSRVALDAILRPWDDVYFRVRDLEHRVSGHGFAGCSRHRLLGMLQDRAVELGVELSFESEITSDDVSAADLIVAADGASSATRERHAEHFRPTVDVRPNRYVWLGTPRPLDAMSFFFAETPHGVFVAHAYPHTRELGTWIVEADEDTFLASGLDDLDEPATVEFLQDVFAEQLDGHPLIANHSHWRQFAAVRCERWVKDNIVLLGDAKATVHYSIGSGTKLAMEDAVALHRALGETATVADALLQYELERKPVVAELQRIAYGSMRWFETYRLRWPTAPAQFILSGVTRKSNETYRSVGEKSPALVKAATIAMAGAGNGDDGRLPIGMPLATTNVNVPTRHVADERDVAGAGVGARRVLIDPARARTDPIDPCSAGLQDLVAVELGSCEQPSAASERFISAAGSVRSPTGIRIVPSPSALAVATACVAAGASFVDLTGGGSVGDQLLASDLIRLSLAVPTLVRVDTVDDANTALASGRADLVMLPVGANKRELRRNAMEPLFVHEMVTIHNGIHSREPYMQHQLQLGLKSTTYDLFGTWKVVGMTGVWPRVLNIWHPREGWRGFGDLLTETYGEVHPNMEGFLSTMDQYRSGGDDRLVVARPGYPDTAHPLDDDPHALFVHEQVTTPAGHVSAYLDAVIDEYRPVAERVGRHLVGAFESVLSDTEAFLLWATTPTAYTDSRGGSDGQLTEWRERAREFATGWKEQLLVGPAGLRGHRDPF